MTHKFENRSPRELSFRYRCPVCGSGKAIGFFKVKCYRCGSLRTRMVPFARVFKGDMIVNRESLRILLSIAFKHIRKAGCDKCPITLSGPGACDGSRSDCLKNICEFLDIDDFKTIHVGEEGSPYFKTIHVGEDEK